MYMIIVLFFCLLVQRFNAKRTTKDDKNWKQTSEEKENN